METGPAATKGRYDVASSLQDHPRTSFGPALDPKLRPGSSTSRPKTSKRPPKDRKRAPQDPQSAPKAFPKEPHRIPKKDLQIGSLFHAFLDALDLQFQCCASAPTQATSDHTTLQVAPKRTLKQHDNSCSPQKFQSLIKPANRSERRV